MTDNETRIAIAEACGWEWKYFRQMGDGGSYGWVKGGCFPQNADPLPFPDYPNDLNAMAEAEATLNGEQASLFIIMLMKPAVGKGEFEVCKFCTHATARQRAEAFLRTTGKWKERQ